MDTTEDTIRDLPPGLTRDCLAPWAQLEVRLDGGVALCCARPPIGNLKSQSLKELMNGDAARELRSQLLNGAADSYCKQCLLAPATTPAALKARVEWVLRNARTK
jgi:hypothetical protein